jgi:hypothetical protein
MAVQKPTVVQKVRSISRRPVRAHSTKAGLETSMAAAATPAAGVRRRAPIAHVAAAAPPAASTDGSLSDRSVTPPEDSRATSQWKSGGL